jgi:hypothetical protein
MVNLTQNRKFKLYNVFCAFHQFVKKLLYTTAATVDYIIEHLLRQKNNFTLNMNPVDSKFKQELF